ncbi:hypothetical protein [Pseudomonas sp. 22 E 5]|nr:hypothetical protein [Pseudomonas sp. 22 E 5]
MIHRCIRLDLECLQLHGQAQAFLVERLQLDSRIHRAGAEADTRWIQALPFLLGVLKPPLQFAGLLRISPLCSLAQLLQCVGRMADLCTRLNVCEHVGSRKVIQGIQDKHHVAIGRRVDHSVHQQIGIGDYHHLDMRSLLQAGTLFANAIRKGRVGGAFEAPRDHVGLRGSRYPFSQ